MRLTEKIDDQYTCDYSLAKELCQKLGQLEDLLEKYEIEDIKELKEVLDDYDEMSVSVVLLGGYLTEKDLIKDFQKWVGKKKEMV